MAINDVTLNVGANLGPAQRQLQAFIAQANRQMGSQSFRFNLDDKGFSQPLGRITGNLNQFQGAMDASIARTLAFGASVGVIGGVTRAFKELVATTVQVEHSIKEINVLLNLSTKELSGFSKALFSVAKNTASSFNTAAEAATEFSRQGLGAAETARRVNDALILSRLSGLEAAKSVDALTAAVNGFKREGISTAEVVNRLANVDAAFAVSSADLAAALSRAGSVSQDAKVKFNELLAATTAVQQATARGGQVIGNGFKTIFTRLQRSKVRSELEKIGVATTDSTGKIRGAISVLQDYAKVYETLSDQQRAYTSEQVAGVFQINTLKALLNDLSSDTSVYTAALKTANKTTNEAVQRNAELNKTLKSLTSQTGTELQELAAKFGKLGLESNFKGILGVLKGALGEMNKVVDSEGLGGDVARGFISGFGKFITGPGLAIALVGIVKLLKFIGRETAVALKQVLAIGSQSQKRMVVQERVNQLLQQDNVLLKQILASEGNMVTINNAVAASIGRQNAALAGQKALVQQISAALALNKGGMLVPRGGRGGGRAPVGRGAEGFVPNMVNRERSSISKGVGGARTGDRPVVIPNFSFGGGKTGTMVAHTGEHIVPNFAGGGSAIFNRDMASSVGLPSGARKISADGFVPSFAPKGAGAKATATKKRKKKRKMLDLDGRSYSYLVPQSNKSASKTASGSFKRGKETFDYKLKNLSIAGPDPKDSEKASGKTGDNLEAKIKASLVDGALAYAKALAGSVNAPFRGGAQKIKSGFKRGGSRGAYGASQAAVGSAFEVGTAAALGIKQSAVKKGKADFDIRGLSGVAKERLVELFGPVGGRSLGDFKVSDTKSNISSFAKKIALNQPKSRGIMGAAAGGFIPNFFKVTPAQTYSSAKGATFAAGVPADVSGAQLNAMYKAGSISKTQYDKAKKQGKTKRDINQADAVYRTQKIVALVSNKMGPKNKYQFGTGGKVAAKFTATGTKNLSGNGPKQVGAIIKPYIHDAADEVFAHMTSKQPQGGIRNIPDGYDKMAGSVFEAAAQKVVRTTQFKSNVGIDVRGMSEERRDLLAGVFNVGSLNEMSSAEIKLGYNKALMKDMVAKIRASGVSKQKGMVIPPKMQHFPQGVAADGFIPNMADPATEMFAAPDDRLRWDKVPGYKAGPTGKINLKKTPSLMKRLKKFGLGKLKGNSLEWFGEKFFEARMPRVKDDSFGDMVTRYKKDPYTSMQGASYNLGDVARGRTHFGAPMNYWRNTLKFKRNQSRLFGGPAAKGGPGALDRKLRLGLTDMDDPRKNLRASNKEIPSLLFGGGLPGREGFWGDAAKWMTGNHASGYIPSFANLAGMSNTAAGKRALSTERTLAGSARMGYDSRVGYGVFNNSQGSLSNAMSQHVNSGDSVSSLGSMGAAAQAAASAAAGFVPGFAPRFPIKRADHVEIRYRAREQARIDKAIKAADKAAQKAAKKAEGQRGDSIKQMGGFMGMMGASTAAGFMQQRAEKAETFEGYSKMRAGSGAASGASIGAMGFMGGAVIGIITTAIGTAIGAAMGGLGAGWRPEEGGGIDNWLQQNMGEGTKNFLKGQDVKKADYKYARNMQEIGDDATMMQQFAQQLDASRKEGVTPMERISLRAGMVETGSRFSGSTRRKIIATQEGSDEREAVMMEGLTQATLATEVEKMGPARERYQKSSRELYAEATHPRTRGMEDYESGIDRPPIITQEEIEELRDRFNAFQAGEGASLGMGKNTIYEQGAAFGQLFDPTGKTIEQLEAIQKRLVTTQDWHDVTPGEFAPGVQPSRFAPEGYEAPKMGMDELLGLVGFEPGQEQRFIDQGYAPHERNTMQIGISQAISSAISGRKRFDETAPEREATQTRDAKFSEAVKAGSLVARRAEAENKFQRELDVQDISQLKRMPSQLITDKERTKQIRGIEDKALAENREIERESAAVDFVKEIEKMSGEDAPEGLDFVKSQLMQGTDVEGLIGMAEASGKQAESLKEMLPILKDQFNIEKDIETSNDNIWELAKKGRENEDRMIELLRAGNVIKSMQTGRGTQREVADERVLLKRSLKTLVEKRGAPGREIGTARDRLLLGAKIEAQQRFVDADLHGANAKQKQEAVKKLDTDIFELNVRNRIQDFKTDKLDMAPLKDPRLVGKPEEIIAQMLPNIRDAIKATPEGAEKEGLIKLENRLKDVADALKEGDDLIKPALDKDIGGKGAQGDLGVAGVAGVAGAEPKKDPAVAAQEEREKKDGGVSDDLLKEIKSLSKAINILSGVIKGDRSSEESKETTTKTASRGHLPAAAGGSMGGRPLQEAFGREKRDISGGIGGARPGTDQPTLIPNFNGGPVVAHTGEYLVDNYSGGKSAIFNREMISSMGVPRGARRIGNAAMGQPVSATGHIPNKASGQSAQEINSSVMSRFRKEMDERREAARKSAIKARAIQEWRDEQFAKYYAMALDSCGGNRTQKQKDCIIGSMGTGGEDGGRYPWSKQVPPDLDERIVEMTKRYSKSMRGTGRDYRTRMPPIGSTRRNALRVEARGGPAAGFTGLTRAQAVAAGFDLTPRRPLTHSVNVSHSSQTRLRGSGRREFTGGSGSRTTTGPQPIILQNQHNTKLLELMERYYPEEFAAWQGSEDLAAAGGWYGKPGFRLEKKDMSDEDWADLGSTVGSGTGVGWQGSSWSRHYDIPSPSQVAAMARQYDSLSQNQIDYYTDSTGKVYEDSTFQSAGGRAIAAQALERRTPEQAARLQRMLYRSSGETFTGMNRGSTGIAGMTPPPLHEHEGVTFGGPLLRPGQLPPPVGPYSPGIIGRGPGNFTPWDQKRLSAEYSERTGIPIPAGQLGFSREVLRADWSANRSPWALEGITESLYRDRQREARRVQYLRDRRGVDTDIAYTVVDDLFPVDGVPSYINLNVQPNAYRRERITADPDIARSWGWEGNNEEGGVFRLDTSSPHYGETDYFRTLAMKMEAAHKIDPYHSGVLGADWNMDVGPTPSYTQDSMGNWAPARGLEDVSFMTPGVGDSPVIGDSSEMKISGGPVTSAKPPRIRQDPNTQAIGKKPSFGFEATKEIPRWMNDAWQAGHSVSYRGNIYAPPARFGGDTAATPAATPAATAAATATPAARAAAAALLKKKKIPGMAGGYIPNMAQIGGGFVNEGPMYGGRASGVPRRPVKVKKYFPRGNTKQITKGRSGLSVDSEFNQAAGACRGTGNQMECYNKVAEAYRAYKEGGELPRYDFVDTSKISSSYGKAEGYIPGMAGGYIPNNAYGDRGTRSKREKRRRRRKERGRMAGRRQGRRRTEEERQREKIERIERLERRREGMRKENKERTRPPKPIHRDYVDLSMSGERRPTRPGRPTHSPVQARRQSRPIDEGGLIVPPGGGPGRPFGDDIMIAPGRPYLGDDIMPPPTPRPYGNDTPGVSVGYGKGQVRPTAQRPSPEQQALGDIMKRNLDRDKANRALQRSQANQEFWRNAKTQGQGFNESIKAGGGKGGIKIPSSRKERYVEKGDVFGFRDTTAAKNSLEDAAQAARLGAEEKRNKADIDKAARELKNKEKFTGAKRMHQQHRDELNRRNASLLDQGSKRGGEGADTSDWWTKHFAGGYIPNFAVSFNDWQNEDSATQGGTFAANMYLHRNRRAAFMARRREKQKLIKIYYGASGRHDMPPGSIAERIAAVDKISGRRKSVGGGRGDKHSGAVVDQQNRRGIFASDTKGVARRYADHAAARAAVNDRGTWTGTEWRRGNPKAARGKVWSTMINPDDFANIPNVPWTDPKTGKVSLVTPEMDEVMAKMGYDDETYNKLVEGKKGVSYEATENAEDLGKKARKTTSGTGVATTYTLSDLEGVKWKEEKLNPLEKLKFQMDAEVEFHRVQELRARVGGPGFEMPKKTPLLVAGKAVKVAAKTGAAVKGALGGPVGIAFEAAAAALAVLKPRPRDKDFSAWVDRKTGMDQRPGQEWRKKGYGKYEPEYDEFGREITRMQTARPTLESLTDLGAWVAGRDKVPRDHQGKEYRSMGVPGSPINLPRGKGFFNDAPPAGGPEANPFWGRDKYGRTIKEPTELGGLLEGIGPAHGKAPQTKASDMPTPPGMTRDKYGVLQKGGESLLQAAGALGMAEGGKKGVASVGKFMVTNADKKNLRALNYTIADIKRLQPQEAGRILSEGIPKGGAPKKVTKKDKVVFEEWKAKREADKARVRARMDKVLPPTESAPSKTGPAVTKPKLEPISPHAEFLGERGVGKKRDVRGTKGVGSQKPGMKRKLRKSFLSSYFDSDPALGKARVVSSTPSGRPKVAVIDPPAPPKVSSFSKFRNSAAMKAVGKAWNSPAMKVAGKVAGVGSGVLGTYEAYRIFKRTKEISAEEGMGGGFFDEKPKKGYRGHMGIAPTSALSMAILESLNQQSVTEWRKGKQDEIDLAKFYDKRDYQLGEGDYAESGGRYAQERGFGFGQISPAEERKLKKPMPTPPGMTRDKYGTLQKEGESPLQAALSRATPVESGLKKTSEPLSKEELFTRMRRRQREALGKPPEDFGYPGFRGSDKYGKGGHDLTEYVPAPDLEESGKFARDSKKRVDAAVKDKRLRRMGKEHWEKILEKEIEKIEAPERAKREEERIAAKRAKSKYAAPFYDIEEKTKTGRQPPSLDVGIARIEEYSLPKMRAMKDRLKEGKDGFNRDSDEFKEFIEPLDRYRKLRDKKIRDRENMDKKTKEDARKERMALHRANRLGLTDQPYSDYYKGKLAAESDRFRGKGESAVPRGHLRADESPIEGPRRQRPTRRRGTLFGLEVDVLDSGGWATPAERAKAKKGAAKKRRPGTLFGLKVDVLDSGPWATSNERAEANARRHNETIAKMRNKGELGTLGDRDPYEFKSTKGTLGDRDPYEFKSTKGTLGDRDPYEFKSTPGRLNNPPYEFKGTFQSGFKGGPRGDEGDTGDTGPSTPSSGDRGVDIDKSRPRPVTGDGGDRSDKSPKAVRRERRRKQRQKKRKNKKEKQRRKRQGSGKGGGKKGRKGRGKGKGKGKGKGGKKGGKKGGGKKGRRRRRRRRNRNRNKSEGYIPNMAEPWVDFIDEEYFDGPDFGGLDFDAPDFGGLDFDAPDFGGPDFGGSDYGGYDFGLGMRDNMVSSMNASNEFLNFSKGGGAGAPAMGGAIAGGGAEGSVMDAVEAGITRSKSSQEKHNVNVNIEVYGNVSEGSLDGIQSNSTDMASILEGLVNG